MADRDTTVYELKSRVMQLCRDKGWGDNGIQNPQHMAMAMTVEMAEMLEHFQWLEEKDVQALMRGEDPRARSADRRGICRCDDLWAANHDRAGRGRFRTDSAASLISSASARRNAKRVRNEP